MIEQFLSDIPPAFVLAENKNHDALIDMANGLMRAVPGLAQGDPMDNANLFLCILEQAYWRGYKDSKRIVEFTIGETPCAS